MVSSNSLKNKSSTYSYLWHLCTQKLLNISLQSTNNYLHSYCISLLKKSLFNLRFPNQHSVFLLSIMTQEIYMTFSTIPFFLSWPQELDMFFFYSFNHFNFNLSYTQVFFFSELYQLFSCSWAIFLTILSLPSSLSYTHFSFFLNYPHFLFFLSYTHFAFILSITQFPFFLSYTHFPFILSYTHFPYILSYTLSSYFSQLYSLFLLSELYSLFILYVLYSRFLLSELYSLFLLSVLYLIFLLPELYLLSFFLSYTLSTFFSELYSLFFLSELYSLFFLSELG